MSYGFLLGQWALVVIFGFVFLGTDLSVLQWVFVAIGIALEATVFAWVATELKKG